jgi:transcriptional regulator with XRE-family HTH domain
MSTKTQLARLADLIKSKRVELGFSQAELGRRLGVTQVTVFNWENQKVMPDTSNVNKIASVFLMSPEELWAYLDGNDRGKEGLDVNRILTALDSMSAGDVATIINAGVQKLAKAS